MSQLGLAFDESFNDPVTISFTGTTAPLAAVLGIGRYVMIATADCRVKRGASGATTAHGSTSFLLKANTYFFFTVTQSDVGTKDMIAAIRDATAAVSGTLEIAKVSR